MSRQGERSRKRWSRVRFGDVVRLSSERCIDPVAAGIDRYVGLEHLEPGDLRIRSWGNVADGVTFTNRFRSGQVLFGKRRAYQRKVAIAEFDGICSSDIYVFEPVDELLLPELLPFICQTDGFFEHALKTSAGSLSPRTNWTSLADYEFDLPPHEVQASLARVIQCAVDSLNSANHAASAANRLALPVFCQLVGIDPALDIRAITAGEINQSTQGIPFRRVNEIGDPERQSVQVGPFGGSVSSQYFADEGVPVLKINNISDDGMFDPSSLVHLERSHALTLAERYAVKGGDVITAAQAVIGRTAIVPDEMSGAIISQHLVRIAVNREVCLPEWLHMCFHAPLVLQQLRSVVQGGTRAGLNSADVRSVVIPLPSLMEQSRILRCVSPVRTAGDAFRARALKLQSIRTHLLKALENSA